MGRALVLALATVLLAGCGTRQRESGGVDTSAANTPQEEEHLYEAAGVVKTIVPNRKHLVVDHGDIPGFMSAMSMPFAVADTSMVTGVQHGDSIRFRISVRGQRIEIVAVDVVW